LHYYHLDGDDVGCIARKYTTKPLKLAILTVSAFPCCNFY